MSLRVGFREMIGQSGALLVRPSQATIGRYSRRGDAIDAAKYVGAASLLGSLLGWLTSIALAGAIGNPAEVLVNAAGRALDTLLGFFFFVFLVQFIGQQQGGLGEFDELAYAFALFAAPIAVLSLLLQIVLPGLGWSALARLVPLLALAANAAFAYLAIRAVLHLRSTRSVLITLGGAVVAVLILNLLFRGVL